MLTSAALAVYLVELVKKLVRELKKDPTYDLPSSVMAALLVAANAVAVLILAYLDVMGYEFPVDWTSWIKALVVAILGALVSSTLYVVGLKPFKVHAEKQESLTEAKSKARKTKKTF